MTEMNGKLQILVDDTELNLDKTFDCGQAFRWVKQPSGEWVGVVNGKIWVLEQNNNVIHTNLDKNSEKELVNYLNLDMDYTNKINSLSLTKFELNAYNVAMGIHILRQDLFETMVTFLMSSCNTMRNIRSIVNKLCEAYGEDITTEHNKKEIKQKSFPTLERLATVSANEFRTFSMGFRADYLYSMCQRLINNRSLLDKIIQCNYKDSLRILKEFTGVGSKVAECIELFSLHHIEAFPIDTHIKAIINKEYDGAIDLSRFKDVAGVIQQYLFYYKAFNK